MPESQNLDSLPPDSGSAPTIPGVSPPAIALAKALTVPYSKAQAQAGKTVGVQPGAAWRAAFDAAAAAGGSLVSLLFWDSSRVDF